MRRHWHLGVLLVAGAALRVAATVAYRPALVYIDTPRYLGQNEGAPRVLAIVAAAPVLLDAYQLQAEQMIWRELCNQMVSR